MSLLGLGLYSLFWCWVDEGIPIGLFRLFEEDCADLRFVSTILYVVCFG